MRSPRFVKQPQNTVALEKGDVTLQCEVRGEPQPIVQWYKNGDLIIESEYFQIVGDQSLKILGLVGLDAGIYQCMASNLAGNIQSSAELKVIKKLGKFLTLFSLFVLACYKGRTLLKGSCQNYLEKPNFFATCHKHIFFLKVLTKN